MAWINRLLSNRFRTYSVVFLLMSIASISMYLAAQAGATSWIWLFLGVLISANLIVLWIK